MELNTIRRDSPGDSVANSEIDDGGLALVAETKAGGPWIHVAAEKNRVPWIAARENGAPNEVGARPLHHHSVAGDHHARCLLRYFKKYSRMLDAAFIIGRPPRPRRRERPNTGKRTSRESGQER